MTAALKKIIEFLQLYKRTPTNGWIIFSGYTSESECIWKVLEPPLPVTRSYYFCDKRFHTELFQDLFADHKEYHVFILDSECVRLYLWKNDNYRMLYKHDVDIATNTRRGGFSANRYRRNREIKKNLLYDTIVEKVPATKPLIFCGYSETFKELQDKFAESKINVIDTVKLSTIQEDKIEGELARQISTSIAKHENLGSYKEFEEFEQLIVTQMDLCVFGQEEVEKYDSLFLVKKLLTSGVCAAKNCKNVVHVPEFILSKCGGCVGVLYYSAAE